MPIDPSFAVARRRVADRAGRAAPTRAAGAGAPAGGGFGDDARQARSQSLTDDPDRRRRRRRRRSPPAQATDPTAVVMAVERAQLAMQLASQIRTKAVEAAQDIFHTQV